MAAQAIFTLLRGRTRPAGQPLGLAAFELEKGLADLVLEVEVGAEVKMKNVQSEGRAPIFARVSMVTSMSRALSAHDENLEVFRSAPPLLQDQLEARRSDGAAEGNPMSTMWTPALSIPASSYFCSGVKATPGVCSPSRRVV
jgi:hypothetical protein